MPDAWLEKRKREKRSGVRSDFDDFIGITYLGLRE